MSMVHQHDERDPLAVVAEHHTGQRRHVAQGAGLEVGAAVRRAAVKAPAQRTVQTHDGQRRFEFGVPRAAPGRTQQLVEHGGADALEARQAGAVFQHQFVGCDASLLQRRPYRPRTFLRRCGRALGLRAQREKQILRHQVVRMLVEPFQHIGQGLGHKSQQRHRRSRLPTRRAREFATGLSPQRAKHLIKCTPGLEQAQVPGLYAAIRWITALDHQLVLGSIQKSRHQRIAPAVARCRFIQAHAVDQRHTG